MRKTITFVQIDKVARAIWADRVQRAAFQGIDLEPWGDGKIPVANGIYEEAIAAIKAMQDYEKTVTAIKATQE
jgi:hypothetical protein